MTSVTFPRLLVAAAVGLAYHWVNVTLLGYYIGNSPINEMLLDALVRRGHLVAYRVLISIHDVVLYLLVALPFAAMFRFIPALRRWTYVAIAAAMPVIAVYALSDWEEMPARLLLSSWRFWFGLSLVALSLPAAFALLNRLRFGLAPTSATPNAA